MTAGKDVIAYRKCDVGSVTTIGGAKNGVREAVKNFERVSVKSRSRSGAVLTTTKKNCFSKLSCLRNTFFQNLTVDLFQIFKVCYSRSTTYPFSFQKSVVINQNNYTIVKKEIKGFRSTDETLLLSPAKL